MNIPSPATVKKIADDRKAREAELASSLANAKEKLPPTKAPSKRPASSAADDSSKSRSSDRTHSRQGGSNRSGNSPTKNSKSKGYSRSTKSTPSTTGSSDTPQDRSSTSTTPRKSSSTQSGKTTSGGTPAPKKPFVRPEHLTQRPLRDNEALQSLRKELEKPARGQFKREYRSNARQSGKNTALKNMKENS